MKKIYKNQGLILKNRKLILATAFLFILAIPVIQTVLHQHYRFASLGIDVGKNSYHVQVDLQRVNEEVPRFWSYHAGVLTNIGADYIEGKLGDSAYGSNGEFADDISLSVNTGSPVNTWTQIPGEIATGGLDRNLGTYTSTGTGTWTIVYQFTASATHTDVQLTGLQWLVTDSSDNNLLAADTFTAVTLNSGDKITVTWTNTVS